MVQMIRSALLVLATVSTTAFAAHPSVNASQQMLKEAEGLLNSTASNSQLFRMGCAYVNKNLLKDAIANELLGRYKDLQRDQEGVRRFRQLITSIFVNRAFGYLEQARGGKFTVFSNVRERNSNTFEVPANFRKGTTTYALKVYVYNLNGSWKFIDASAMGYSAVGYFKGDIQAKLNSEFNKDTEGSRPVSAFVDAEISSSGFAMCP